jgi:hypothetical protein
MQSAPEKGAVVERFPSGQREQTVNLSAKPSEVRILPSPPSIETDVGDSGKSAVGHCRLDYNR